VFPTKHEGDVELGGGEGEGTLCPLLYVEWEGAFNDPYYTCEGRVVGGGPLRIPYYTCRGHGVGGGATPCPLLQVGV